VARELRRELASAHGRTHLVGIVEAWGSVELHRDGFRAEYARPHAFVVFRNLQDPGHAARARQAASAHGVPVLEFSGARGLHRYCVEHALGMTQRTVHELLRPVGARALPGPPRRGESILEAIGVVVGCLVFAAVSLVALGLALQLAIALFGGEDGPPATIGANRHLRVVEQVVLPLDDGEALYVALVKNTHPRRTALGVFPRGELRSADGAIQGAPDPRFDVEQRPTLAPGQTGVVFDVIQGLDGAADAVTDFDVVFRARGFRIGPRRPPVTAGATRFDRRRCLVSSEMASERALVAVDVAVLGRDAHGRIDAGGLVRAGPLRKGRSRQVLDRVSPEVCRDGLPRLEAYPNLRPGQMD
jgi:hypothetical protein